MDYDAIIVGGGPAGLSAAVHLRRHGKTVLILAKDQVGRRFDLISPDAKEELARLNLDAALVATMGSPCYGIQAQWGATTAQWYDFVSHAHGNGLIIDRKTFDTALQHHALRNGAHMITACYEHAEHDGHVWRVTFSSATHRCMMRGRVLLDASGRASLVARTLGRLPTYYEHMVAIGCMHRARAAAQVLSVVAAPYGWWYTLPVLSDYAMTFLVTDASIGRELCATEPITWTALARQYFPGARTSEVQAFPCGTRAVIPRGTGWTGAGDAIAAYDPLAGTGILHALRSGRLSAAAINKYVAGDGDALGRYAAQEQEIFLAYLHTRERQYRSVTKFLQETFWERRSGLSHSHNQATYNR